MDTQTIVILAVAINVAVAAAAILIPWIVQRRDRSVARQRRTALMATVGNPPLPLPDAADVEAHVAGGADGDRVDVAADAAAPWFPARGEPSDAPPMAGWADRDLGRRPGPTGLDGPIDADTGLDAGAAWARWLSEEEARIRRFHRPATVVLVELSGLDRLAERLGREAAGRLIPPIATVMRREARATDHLARLGPTRFAALLPETDEVRAINYVERVRSACDVWLESGAVALRLSMGWAQMTPNRSADVALADAETRLYAERQRPHGDAPRFEEPRAGSTSLAAVSNG